MGASPSTSCTTLPSWCEARWYGLFTISANVPHGEIDRAVGVGIIGAGNVLPAYLAQLDRLVPRGLARYGPVCARSPARREELARMRPGLELVDSAEAVVESDVDIVVVVTPPDVHPAHVRLALEHGRHVLCEKPLASSRSEAEALFELARQRGLQLISAPFVQTNPTFRELWTIVQDGAIGRVHSARALYGTAGSTWATWFHDAGIGPLPDIGIYNLRSLTALCGPVVETYAADVTAVPTRVAAGITVDDPDPDTVHLLLRHAGGALSSIVSSHAIQHYRRPALELYGDAGTANLLGDDWDPAGFELWQNAASTWELHEPIDSTWLWTDGLRELVQAIRQDRAARCSESWDLHLIEILESARTSIAERRPVRVESTFRLPELRLEQTRELHHLHDHTRSPDEQ
jgi:predicted dehydrogenase